MPPWVRTVAPVVMSILIALGFIWLPIVFWFFRRLRIRHRATYEELGSPSIFWNNSMRNNWLVWKFVWSTRPRQLGDPKVAKVALLMRIFIVCYVALFGALVLVFASALAK